MICFISLGSVSKEHGEAERALGVPQEDARRRRGEERGRLPREAGSVSASSQSEGAVRLHRHPQGNTPRSILASHPLSPVKLLTIAPSHHKGSENKKNSSKLIKKNAGKAPP